MNKERVSNELTVFNDKEFGQIRTATIDGEPWFVAIDVCRALEIANTPDAMEKLDDDEKMTIGLGDSHSGQRGGAQCMTVINEPGLYTLVIRSRKPSAKLFRRWVTHDVIPSIRKHGMYATDEILNDPDLLEAQAKKLREERENSLTEQVSTLTSDNKRLTAMVTSYETKLFIRDHLKDIFDFINKCVRSYAALTKDGKIGYGWKDYYDQLSVSICANAANRTSIVLPMKRWVPLSASLAILASVR